MSGIGEMATKTFYVPGLGSKITYNPQTMVFTGVVMFGILFLAFVVVKSKGKKLSRIFTAFEILYKAFLDMAEEAMHGAGRKFTPLVFTIFLFVLFSNWLGIIPGMKSPTHDLNTCLALGILVFIIAHTSAIMKKGFRKYIKGYFEPFFFFLPMNLIGEVGKLVSHSFRLFGNIFAGAIIFALVGPVIIKTFNAIGLPTYSATPAILGTYLAAQAFFGLFVGTIQALVFALLALTYIAILREE